MPSTQEGVTELSAQFRPKGLVFAMLSQSTSPAGLSLTLFLLCTLWVRQTALWVPQPELWVAQLALWVAQPTLWVVQPLK